jgi:hypothetical protein
MQEQAAERIEVGADEGRTVEPRDGGRRVAAE